MGSKKKQARRVKAALAEIHFERQLGKVAKVWPNGGHPFHLHQHEPWEHQGKTLAFYTAQMDNHDSSPTAVMIGPIDQPEDKYPDPYLNLMAIYLEMIKRRGEDGKKHGPAFYDGQVIQLPNGVKLTISEHDLDGAKVFFIGEPPSTQGWLFSDGLTHFEGRDRTVDMGKYRST